MKRALFGLFLIFFCLMAFSLSAVSAQHGLSPRDSVLHLVVEQLLDRSLDDKRVYITESPLDPGTAIQTWTHTVLTTDRTGWLVFIDDMARANFEHPCRYVFVDRDSHAISVYEETTPPADLMSYYELDTEMKRIDKAAHRIIATPYRGARKEFPNPRSGNTYAVLLSGGASQGSNYIRYWNDTSFMYKTLKEVYGFNDDDIYCLVSDGTDPAPDISDGTNSDPDLDGDGTDDIDGPCITTAIQGVFDTLATFVTAQDQIFIFSTDHGGSESGWDVYLNLWNSEVLNDDALAVMVNSLPAAQFVVTMEQCFSGGFEDDLQTVSPRIFSSAAAYTEYSWAMGDLIYDEYVYYWISAVRGEDPYGTPVDADINGDSEVTMDEAFIYAEAHDTASETPQYDDNPVGLGAAVSLFFGDRGTLDGTVTESGTGIPIEAEIGAYRQSTGTIYTGISDAGTGAYSMGLPVDTYDVTATAFGYLPSTSLDLDILLDTSTTENFVLSPAATGTVQGTVESEVGAELAGVRVDVLNTPVSPVYTNGSGFYTVDLPGGDSYDLRFTLAGYQTTTVTAVAVTEGGTTVQDVIMGDWPSILVWEPDPSPSSGSAVQTALMTAGWESVLVTDLFEHGTDLGGYQAIFVLVGIYSNNYTFTSGSAEESALVSYLDAGGNLYLEGGDIWCYDSYPSTLRGYFNIIDEGDGGSDLSRANGVMGTFTFGMTFSYSGENSYMDHLGASLPAYEIFTNPDDGYGHGVAHDAGTYRTIAVSYEFGGLDDALPPNTKADLMQAYLDFFGLELGPMETVQVGLTCLPESGVLPFATHITCELTNLAASQRTVQASLGITLASGSHYSNFRSGSTNLSVSETHTVDWNQNLPAVGNLLGTNTFLLEGFDVTPSPYNQPPYPPAGDSDTDSCAVEGMAP